MYRGTSTLYLGFSQQVMFIESEYRARNSKQKQYTDNIRQYPSLWITQNISSFVCDFVTLKVSIFIEIESSGDVVLFLKYNLTFNIDIIIKI